MSYTWRHLTPQDRADLLRIRQLSGQPWHGPPHGLESHWYHLSASCYEHKELIGATPERLTEFEQEMLRCAASTCQKVSAWCVLPNHYHLLVQCRDVAECRRTLGRLHGSTSHEWNVADGAAGRKCWHRRLPRPVRGERHRWATMNYIHHNPVHHRYVQRWQDWLFSSAGRFLDSVGRDEAERIWREYPVLGMGENWDPPEA